MIGKIDPELAFNTNPTIRPPFRGRENGSDFHSLLKGKIEEFQPLERMVIEVLSRALDFLLAENDSMKEELFLVPPLLLPPKEKAQMPIPEAAFAIGPPTSASENLRENRDFDPIIKQAGQEYGVDPYLIKAVIQAESSGNPGAVSSAGAQGLMQLMPKTAADLGVYDSFDPAQNIMGGTRYLRQLLDRYRGDRKLALAAYNWGMGNIENRLQSMPKETRNYIVKVENYYRDYSTT
jgi:soluble lytic murein transglycosylase-like protein